MSEIKNGYDLNIALHSNIRHFMMAGPTRSGRLHDMLQMVHHVGGRTTIPEQADCVGNPLSLADQIRSGAITAGNNSNFGFILVNVGKAHFDEVTLANWDKPDQVFFAYRQLIAAALEDYYSYASIDNNLAVLFNFNDAPFARNAPMFRTFEMYQTRRVY